MGKTQRVVSHSTVDIIPCGYAWFFNKRLNEVLAQGWTLVPGSVHRIDYSGGHTFYATVERDEKLVEETLGE